MRCYELSVFVLGLAACGRPAPPAAVAEPTVVVGIPKAPRAEDDTDAEDGACAFEAGPRADFVPSGLVVSEGDPAHGRFTLRQATRGLVGTGSLLAVIETDLGTLNCELWHERAPYTVANFVGLARGLRPFRDSKTERWQSRRAYDHTSFHRIIPGFVLQGGDPTGTGKGEPGYAFPDEIWEGALHDQRGLLCMANKGPHTNGMQFFILDGAAPHLDGQFPIFGRCGPSEVIDAISAVATGPGGRPEPLLPIHRLTIKVERPCGAEH